MGIKKFEGIVQVRWHHWSALGASAIYDAEIDGKLPESGGSVGGLPFDKLGFDALHGSRYRITVEEIEHGEEIPNPWHGTCAECGKQQAGHERTCCPTTGPSRYGNKYICDECWGDCGLTHYAKCHPKEYVERRRAFERRGLTRGEGA